MKWLYYLKTQTQILWSQVVITKTNKCYKMNWWVIAKMVNQCLHPGKNYMAKGYFKLKMQMSSNIK